MSRVEALGKLHVFGVNTLTATDLKRIAGEIQAEVDERYMLLPLDADGTPCKVGDTLDWDGGRHEVMAVDGDCVWFDTDEHELKLTPYEASGCRHCDPDGWYKCPECSCVVGYDVLVDDSWSIMMDDYQIPFNNCPSCGKSVKR